jgi:GNAT superfamily N-acetyltransferase
MSLVEAPTFAIRHADCRQSLTRLAIIDIHEECFGDEIDCPSLKEGYWWVVWDDDTPVGFCCLRRAAATPGAGYLARSGVMPRARGYGLQKRLIAVREEKARALGLIRMVSDTTENVHSSNNLMACGYRLFDPMTRWAFEHSLYWQKRLVADH